MYFFTLEYLYSIEAAQLFYRGQLRIKYSFRFILIVILDLDTQIKKILNFTYFSNKIIIINTSDHISTNKKNRLKYKVNKFCIKIIK